MGAGLLLWLVQRLWLGKTGGCESLPLSECIPPPIMRAAALSHLLPVAGWLCRAAGGCRWADDSAKLRSLSAAGSASAVGAVRPVAAPARIRAQLLPPLPSPQNAATPTPRRAQGLSQAITGLYLPPSTTCLPYFRQTVFRFTGVHWVLFVFRGLQGSKCHNMTRNTTECHIPRRFRVHEAAGSNPATPTRKKHASACFFQ